MTKSDFVALRAEKLLKAGLESVSAGDLRKALEDFKASAELHPSAEALTYWGWMEHHLGDTPAAIVLCKRAIEVDPTFGNPYNDIGSYLVSRGELDEAIPWFEKAKGAENYEPRQFPHMNLGKIYLGRKQYGQALLEFEAALEFAPGDSEIRHTIEFLRIQRATIN